MKKNIRACLTLFFIPLCLSVAGACVVPYIDLLSGEDDSPPVPQPPTFSDALIAVPLKSAVAAGDTFNPSAALVVYLRDESGGVRQLDYAANDYAVTLAKGASVISVPQGATHLFPADDSQNGVWTAAVSRGGGQRSPIRLRCLPSA